MDSKTLENKFYGLLGEFADLETAKQDLAKTLKDLGLDEMDATAFLVGLEEEFKIELPSTPAQGEVNLPFAPRTQLIDTSSTVAQCLQLVADRVSKEP